MTFIKPPDTSNWDAKKITDHDTLVALADLALCWCTELHPDAQEAILGLLGSVPSAALDFEDIAKLALGADERAVDQGETHEVVLDAAWGIVTRPEILAELDGTAILKHIKSTDVAFDIATIGVNLLAELPVERIPVHDLVEFARENAGADDDFDDAVFALLDGHKLHDAMRQCFNTEGDPDEDSELAALCREAIAALAEGSGAS
jgi:hypothetical protein